MSPYKILCLLFLFAVVSCDMKGRRMDQESIREEKKNREIKRVREVDVLNAALEEGRSVVEIAQEELLNRLQQAIDQHGVAGAVEYCNVQALPLMDSLSQAGKIKVRRVSHRFRNPEDKPGEIEVQLLNAYDYSIEQNEDPGDNIQMLDNGKILYTKPIVIKTPLCLNCHGAENMIAADTRARIEQLYPQDKATGFEQGDLRGMWSIELEKKEVIKDM